MTPWFTFKEAQKLLTDVGILNRCTSSCQEINCGVPQGSMLGPMSFITYFSGFQRAAKNVTISIYVRDTLV